MTKRESPYTRLQREARQWAFNVKYRHRKALWFWAKPEGDILRLYERVHAADALGYDVLLEVKGEELHATYVKRIDDAPWSIRP